MATIKQIQTEVRAMGFTCSWKSEWQQFRVNFVGGTEDSAMYFDRDATDIMGTCKEAMERHKAFYELRVGIDQLTSDLDQIGADIATLESDIDQLSADVAEFVAEVEALQDEPAIATETVSVESGENNEVHTGGWAIWMATGDMVRVDAIENGNARVVLFGDNDQQFVEEYWIALEQLAYVERTALNAFRQTNVAA